MNEEINLMTFVDFKDNNFLYELYFITTRKSNIILDENDMTYLIQELFGKNGVISVSYDVLKKKDLRFVVGMMSNVLDLSSIKNILNLLENGFIVNGYDIYREKILFPVSMISKIKNLKINFGYFEVHTDNSHGIKNIDRNYLIKKVNNIFEIRVTSYDERMKGSLKYVWYDSNPIEDFIIS